MELATITPVTLPAPSTPITIRPAHMGDLPFIDSLQKMHTNAVGWMPMKQLEGKIGKGQVLIAEKLTADNADSTDKTMHSSALSVLSAVQSPLGYCIGHDQYFKRDDVGIVYQLNVLPNRQRGLIGAHLLKAVFDRAAYGCRLFCCWCAQDLAANYFWESMGFVPLAFRAGSRARGRVHIFWQKRIRAGDEGPGATPWWFPCKTDSGSIREDRLVLPIPPGLRWNDEMPVLLPREQQLSVVGDPLPGKTTMRRSRSGPARNNLQLTTSSRHDLSAAVPSFSMKAPVMEAIKPPKTPKPKVKIDAKLITAARELRDRWLEEVNAGKYLLESAGKYEIGRAIASAVQRPALLEAA